MTNPSTSKRPAIASAPALNRTSRVLRFMILLGDCVPLAGTASCPGHNDLQRAGLTGMGEHVVRRFELVHREVVGDELCGVELVTGGEPKQCRRRGRVD